MNGQVVIRTNSDHADFGPLVRLLDQDLALKNGSANDFFAQFNKIDHLKNVVLVYLNNQAVGCGAFKEYSEGIVEIKRMYVRNELRGKGLSRFVLCELEHWAQELGHQRCILETGDKMIEAIGLYTKSGYKVIPNYGQYADVESSICFEKLL